MVVAPNLLAEKKGDMLISAGCTGALVAGSTLVVKRLPGIKRPALAPVLPSQTGEVLFDRRRSKRGFKAAVFTAVRRYGQHLYAKGLWP